MYVDAWEGTEILTAAAAVDVGADMYHVKILPLANQLVCVQATSKN